MSIQYDEYLLQHKENVQKGWIWIKDHILNHLIASDQTIKETDIFEVDELIEYHDNSKYIPEEEYFPYDEYFYGANKSYQVVENFKKAFLLHIHRNPHHWQFWVLIHDDPKEEQEALEMPVEYIFEMICDWWSFSWQKGDLTEIFRWWEDHKDYILLHKNTRGIVEKIFTAMRDILTDENYVIHSDDDEDENKYGVPKLKKFPMPDADHVRSAIKFFNYISPKYEEELADAILDRMKEYGMTFEDVGVGDKNRFKKYIPKKDLNDHLEHHGILGQKWGVRRFQNEDGSRTSLGKEARKEHTVFISGSSKTQTEGSPYRRKSLPDELKNEIKRHMGNGDKIIVGDAPGIDRQVQDYLNEQGYTNVEIYGPGKQVRYSANKDWKTNPIDAPEYAEGSKEWLAKKDIVMSKIADEGLAVILDEGATATRKNVDRLLEDNKDVKVYQLNANGKDDWVDYIYDKPGKYSNHAST